MSVTIKDVAKAAGVSVATVSRVINGFDTVDESLKTKVEEKVNELGFMPNHVARSLKIKTTNTIGVAVSDISNPFFISVAKEIEKIIRQHGYSMLMVSTDADKEKERENINLFDAKRVDGMIISPNSKDVAKYIKNINAPVVAMDRKVLENLCDSVYVDKEKSMYDIVSYLFKKGHTSIAMVTGQKDLSTNYDRFNGFIKAHFDSSIKINNENIMFGKFNAEFGKEAFEKLTTKNNPPTAIISGNALIMSGFLIQAKKQGVSIPSDVSLVSFGSLDLQELIDIKVTYIEELHTEIGRIAGEMILDRINNPGKPIELDVLKARIIEGNSVKAI